MSDQLDPADALAIPCSVLRGGTSRGVFFHRDALPYERDVIDRILLNVFGSPDARQTNGLGGATSQTSKAAIIGPPTKSDADVDYTFAQVGIDKPVVDWGGNCGNISSAVGPYAINAGLVAPFDDPTTVRIHNTNTGKLIVARVPVIGRRFAAAGDYAIDGVAGTGPRIKLAFHDPSGAVSGKLLPTGSPTDTVTVADGRTFTISVVDAANPTVFVRAEDAGLTGVELPPQLAAATAATDLLEEIRGIVATWLGLADDPATATERSPGLPKVGVVAAPKPYDTTGGRRVEAAEMDVLGRLMSMQTPHRAYMITGGIATAAAALIDSTVVNAAARKPELNPDGSRTVRIGHPSGILEATVVMEGGAAGGLVSVAVSRTARAILDGSVYVPKEIVA